MCSSSVVLVQDLLHHTIYRFQRCHLMDFKGQKLFFILYKKEYVLLRPLSLKGTLPVYCLNDILKFRQ